MTAYNIPRLNFVPPDKGSFPLDHEGVCKELVMKYKNCLIENDEKVTPCRHLIKAFLDCRMNNELMAKESWDKLGFGDDEGKEEIAGTDVITDMDEWNAWNARGDPVIHIELSKWADLFLIAPLDANTLGKLANGLCDNLLTSVARAWNMEKPFFFCPAMNTKMYEHPITSRQISILKSWGYFEIPVVSKLLMCGDKGLGAMAEVDTIVLSVMNFFKKT